LAEQNAESSLSFTGKYCALTYGSKTPRLILRGEALQSHTGLCSKKLVAKIFSHHLVFAIDIDLRGESVDEIPPEIKMVENPSCQTMLIQEVSRLHREEAVVDGESKTVAEPYFRWMDLITIVV
jgi:hypothetical protein